MAKLDVDGWALKPITLDLADQYIPDTLVANANDANGRGIDLRLTRDGMALDTTGMRVFLIWRHRNGNQDITEFTAADAATGHWRVHYPPAMTQEGGMTLARISIHVGEQVITGSRDFRIHVEPSPIDEDDAMADERFSLFVQATLDLNELEGKLKEAEAARVEAENGRKAAEDARVKAEDSRVKAEQAREASEADRKSAETARDTAEDERVAAEAARKTAESGRVDAESKRDTAEKGRVSAESGRVDAEKAREASEAERKTAETARGDAESARAAAEAERKTAETGRADAEKARAAAEDARESAETARDTAEKARAAAETAREEASASALADAKSATDSAKQALTDAQAAKKAVDDAMAEYTTITSSVVEYQAGDSPTTPPTGTWAATVPAVAKGGYLWARTTIKHNKGADSVIYAVAYQGKDGGFTADTVLGVANGGTGATNAAGALTNLGAASDADLDALAEKVAAILAKNTEQDTAIKANQDAIAANKAAIAENKSAWDSLSSYVKGKSGGAWGSDLMYDLFELPTETHANEQGWESRLIKDLNDFKPGIWHWSKSDGSVNYPSQDEYGLLVCIGLRNPNTSSDWRAEIGFAGTHIYFRIATKKGAALPAWRQI